MALARYVRLEDFSGCEAHTGDFALGRVGLFGLGGEDLHHDALALRVGVEQGRFGEDFFGFGGAFEAHGLVERAECGRGGVELEGGVGVEW
jgi:hypothetical protein